MVGTSDNYVPRNKGPCCTDKVYYQEEELIYSQENHNGKDGTR